MSLVNKSTGRTAKDTLDTRQRAFEVLEKESRKKNDQEKISALEQTLRQKDKELKEWQKLGEDLQKQIGNLTTENNTLILRNEKLNQENRRLNNSQAEQKGQLIEQVESLTKQLETLNQENQRLNKENRAENVQMLKEKQKQTEQEKQKLRAELNKSYTRMKNLNFDAERQYRTEKGEKELAKEKVKVLEKSLFRVKIICSLLLVAVVVLAVTAGIFIHKSKAPIQEMPQKGIETPVEQSEPQKAIEVQQEQENASTGQITPYNVTVKQDGVNVYQTPDANSQALGTVNANDIVVANGEPQNGWQEVTWCEQTAYISQQYLDYPEQTQETGGVWDSIKGSLVRYWYFYAVVAFVIYCVISGRK